MNIREDPNNLSGLDYLRRRIADPKGTGLSGILNMRLVEVADGQAIFEARPTPDFYNPHMRVHGGYAATLIDSAMGCAVQTKLAASIGYGTVDLAVKYVRKIIVGSSPLRCTGTVLHAGRTMFTAEAKVIDVNGKLCAHGTGTFLVYPQ